LISTKILPSAKFNSREIYQTCSTAKFNSTKMKKIAVFGNREIFFPRKFLTIK